MSAPISVADAQSRILSAMSPTSIESVTLGHALNRVTAQPLSTLRRQPPAAISAMDGFAVRSADFVTLPTQLTVVARIAAGESPHAPIAAGEAARIFTGALMPDGANMVALQENAREDGDRVTIFGGDVAPGRNVRPAGSDFDLDEILIPSGTRLGPRQIALLAAMDIAKIPVRRKPIIGVLATGDELTRAGQARGPAQVVAASLDGILAQIDAWGGAPRDLGIAPDRAEAIATAADQAREMDMLITLGGASVGDHDLVRHALISAGMSLNFWRIAMRPGKPLMFGSFAGGPYLGLPGNPVSALVCSMLFLKPAIFHMLGRQDPPHILHEERLACDLGANDSRQDYVRAAMTADGVRASPTQDSGQLRVLSAADVLIVRPPHDRARVPGDTVNVLSLENC